MTEHSIYIPETGEKFELLCGRSQLRRMVKQIEGKKIFSKAKTRTAKYHMPVEVYNFAKEHPDWWIHRDNITDIIWATTLRPGNFGDYIVLPKDGDLKILTFNVFIPANTIVACSDVLKYGRVVYE